VSTAQHHDFDWFKLADYQASTRLELSDWAEMISRRSGWQTILEWFQANFQHEKKWYQGNGEQEKKQLWDDYVTDVLPCNLGASRPKWYLSASTRLKAITDITHSFKEAGDFEIEAAGAHVLIVDIRAPDTVLQRCFKNWLMEQRKRSSLPTKRRGKPSVNVEITSDHTRSWAEYNILAVLDLDFYAEVFGIKSLTDEQLGNLLERSLKVDPKAWGRNARAKATEAMQCLDVIMAQNQARTGARESAPK
jgi:hypothetical protein